MKLTSIDIPNSLKHDKNKINQQRIRDNKTIREVLQNFGIHMNLTLKDTKDISGTKIIKLGKILLRGNIIITISLPKE